jgi:hypothetical protein
MSKFNAKEVSIVPITQSWHEEVTTILYFIQFPSREFQVYTEMCAPLHFVLTYDTG